LVTVLGRICRAVVPLVQPEPPEHTAVVIWMPLGLPVEVVALRYTELPGVTGIPTATGYVPAASLDRMLVVVPAQEPPLPVDQATEQASTETFGLPPPVKEMM
jgi:hypothetical protein